MGSTNELVEGEKWDKLKSWGSVQKNIIQRLEAPEKYDHSLTLYHGPQLYHTMQHPGHIKSMIHFTSTTGEMFVSHFRLGTSDILCVWNVDTREREAKCTQQRFIIHSEITSLLYVPKHRIYLGFCSDLELRIYTDASSNCTEKGAIKCSTTILCMAYNLDLDEVYLGGIGTLERWKVTGTEHAATAYPTTGFQTSIGQDEWVIDIKVDNGNEQVLVLTYHHVFLINYLTQKQIHCLQNRHEASLKCCCFYRQREYLITGGRDGAVKVWNAVVFTQVHVFYGHRDAITGLAVHKKDPLLFSSSLDGSVQIWRMDNFSKLMRFDIAEKILHMKLVGNEQFFCQTEKEIRIFNLNQFYQLFAPVESTVHHLQLCQGLRRLGQANRIIASTEDGSVRLLSPLTGTTLTLIYPMPSFQILKSFAYNRNTDKLMTVLENGEVITFNCESNPCRAEEVWKPYSFDEGITQLVQVTLGYTMKDGQSATDVVVFGGLRNGQISLLDARSCVMTRVQGHSGDVTCMEYTAELDDNGFQVKETSRTLVTGGKDNSVKLWQIYVSPGRKYYVIELQLLLRVLCQSTPCHLSMYENTLCVGLLGDTKIGNLQMLRVERLHPDETGLVVQYTQLTHAQEEDHQKQVTSVDKCPLLGLFASCSEDGYVKIWNCHSQLIREMSFGEPLYGLCFANSCGDLLIGFHSHVCLIPLTSYFPQNYLEKIVLQDFQDDLRENPILYNSLVKPWFDPRKLPKFSTTLTHRLKEKNKTHKSAVTVVEDLAAITPTPGGDTVHQIELQDSEQEEENKENSYEESFDWKERIEEEEEEEEEDIDEDFEFDIVANSSELVSSTESVVMENRQKQHSHTERKHEAVTQQELQITTALNQCVSGLQVARGVSERTTPNNLDQLTPWERELLKRKRIIPTDGYIPNSVVRKRLGYIRPATPPVRKADIWTLKPVPKPDPRHMPYGWEGEEYEKEDEPIDFDELAAKFGFNDQDSDSDNIIHVESDDYTDNDEAESKEIKLMPCYQKRNNKRTKKKRKVGRKSADDSDDEKPQGQGSHEKRVSRLVPGQDPKNMRSFTWDYDDDEGRQSSVSAPWRKMGSMVRAGSTLSNTSSKRGSKLSRRSTPVTPKFELRSKKFEFGKHDFDIGTPDSSRSMRKSGGPRSRERTKSFRLTHMVVDEHSTDVRYKDGRKSGKRVSLLGTADLESVKMLLKEDWFDDLKETPSFDSIMQRLLTMLDTDDSDLHKRICNYIMEIHKDVGIPDMYLDRIINKLSTQMGNSDRAIKHNNLTTLKEIGASRPDVISALLPRLIDSRSDIRDLAAEVLADLVGVEDKEDLFQLMQEMGLARSYNSKEDEEEALKALAMRLDVPYRSESFTDWINNWVNESTPDMYEEDLKVDDITRHWDKRTGQRLPGSLCLTESSSRASNRLRELSFLSDRSTCIIEYKMDLDRNSTFDSDLTFGDVCLPSELNDDTVDTVQPHVPNTMETVNKPTTPVKIGRKATNPVDLDPELKSGQQVWSEGHSEGHSESLSSDGGFESMYTGVGTQSEVRSLRKQVTGSTLTMTESDRLSIHETEVKGHVQTESEVKSDSLKTDKVVNRKTRDSTVDSGVKGEVDAGIISQGDVIQETSNGKWNPPTPEDGRVQRSIMMDEAERDAAVIRSLPTESSLTPVSVGKRIPRLEELEEEEDDGFDPRNPQVYEYYKKRFSRNRKPGSGKLAYGGFERFPGRKILDLKGDADSSCQMDDTNEYRIASDDELGQHSQVEDSELVDQTMATEAIAETMSTQDSGIGQEISETFSSKSSQHSQQGQKPHRYLRKGKHRSKHEWPKHSLSPVKSSSSLAYSDRSTPQERIKDMNWQKFFTTPTAMERKRLEKVKKEFSLGKTKPPHGQAVFRYIATDLPMLPGEAGLRLLHSVRVGDKGPAQNVDGRHRVESIPGKLMVETKNEDTGKSNFGILQMQWTTGVPNYQSGEEHRKTTPLSDDSLSQKSRSYETLTDRSERSYGVPADRLPKLAAKLNRSKRKDDKAEKVLVLPNIGMKTARHSPDYQWDHPLPPPPAKDSRTNIARIRKQHEHYCKYYDLTKKKMQHYTSVSKYLSNLQLFAQMAETDERKATTTTRSYNKKCVVSCDHKRQPRAVRFTEVIVKTE